MEKLFSKAAWFSATVVLLVLLSTLYVLYTQAKPAIQAYGWGFLIDTRWAVPIESTTAPSQAAASSSPTAMDGDIPVDDGEEEAVPSFVPQSQGSTDDIPMDDGEEEAVPAFVPQSEGGNDIRTDEDEDIAALVDASQPQSGQSTAVTEIYGGLVPIVGTVLSTLIAMAFSIPIAMGIAVFLSEISLEWLKTPVGVAIELLAAIPSIIYGMWGLFFFGPFIASIFGGSSVSLLVGGLVLGVMVIPFMAALSRDAINTTPDVLKESAYAVGATRFEVVKDIIFPYAKTGILGSVIISLGRALGETMAVAFVIGGVYELAEHLTDPTISIPVALANNFAESAGIGLSALYYLAFILFVVSFIIIFLAKEFLLRRSKP